MKRLTAQGRPTFNKPLLGLVAAGFSIVMWSAAPLLIAPANGIPPWFLVAAALLAATLVLLPMSRGASHPRTLSRRWDVVLHGVIPLLILGAVGSFVVAVGSDAGSQTALITYTWPVLFILLLEGLHRRRLSMTSLTGGAIAFAGAALLMGPDLVHHADDIGAGGYLMASVAALSWALYSLICRLAPVPVAPLLPRLCLTAAVMALLVHMVVERGQAQMDPMALIAALALGAGPYGLAMVTWDYALRQSPPVTVGTMAYAVPILASVFMLLGGVVTPDWRLPVAGVLVMVGCVVAGRNRRRPDSGADNRSDRDHWPDQRRSGFRV